jgi:hypothetical protein
MLEVDDGGSGLEINDSVMLEVNEGGLEVSGGVLEVDGGGRIEVNDGVLRAGVEDYGKLRGQGQGRRTAQG